jgi:hypothetical protein
MDGPASSGPVPKPGKYLKVSLFLKKLPTVTDDYFHAYWANNHVKVALENDTFRHKVRRYNQVRVLKMNIVNTVLHESTRKCYIRQDMN